MRDSVLIGPGGHPMRPKPLLRTTLGQILRRARREQGRTLADVARAARVSMPYLSELERGRKEASSEVLAAVCEALRIELSDLLAEAGRHLADERARRALIEERARRRRERAGELRRESRGRAGDLPLDAGDLHWTSASARRNCRRSRGWTSRSSSRWTPSAAAVSRRPAAAQATRASAAVATPRPSPPDQRPGPDAQRQARRAAPSPTRSAKPDAQRQARRAAPSPTRSAKPDAQRQARGPMIKPKPEAQ